MCKTCGCSDATETRLVDPATGEMLAWPAERQQNGGHAHDGPHAHDHSHEHDQAHDGHHHAHSHRHGHEHLHAHEHAGATPAPRRMRIERDLLAGNDLLAARNRGWFEGRGILAVNLMSSPGAGKTTLLERTIRDLSGSVPISVIEGDQETAEDARRILAAGGNSVQVNTGAGCHLEADMVYAAASRLAPPPGSLLFIENVGNLVCPALFDLGETARVVFLSVPEGDTKPLKYPHMFRSSQLMLVSKTDLLPHVEFDIDRCLENARRINPSIEAIRVSAKSGEGVSEWLDWLRRAQPAAARHQPALVGTATRGAT